jgi:hypothetical protein
MHTHIYVYKSSLVHSETRFCLCTTLIRFSDASLFLIMLRKQIRKHFRLFYHTLAFYGQPDIVVNMESSLIDQSV